MLDMFRSMESTEASGTPSTVPSSRIPRHATALSVGERADGLERVLTRLGPAALELDAYALACLDVPVKRIAHEVLRSTLDTILDIFINVVQIMSRIDAA